MRYFTIAIMLLASTIWCGGCTTTTTEYPDGSRVTVRAMDSEAAILAARTTTEVLAIAREWKAAEAMQDAVEAEAKRAQLQMLLDGLLGNPERWESLISLVQGMLDGTPTSG